MGRLSDRYPRDATFSPESRFAPAARPLIDFFRLLVRARSWILSYILQPAASSMATAGSAAKGSRKSATSTGTNSNSSKSATTGSGSGKGSAKDAAGAKKPSLKLGDPAAPPEAPAAGAAPAVLLWPNGKPILGSDGKPIDPATLTVVIEKDGKSVVHGPDGKPFLLPGGKALDPALVPPKEEPPPPPPKPYLGVPPARFLRPPWEKPPWQGPGSFPPRFLPYSPALLRAASLKLPPQVEFQDAAWERTMLDLRNRPPRLLSLHLGPVAVTFEKHAGPVQCFIRVLCRDIPDMPELVGKSQFSACNFYPSR